MNILIVDKNSSDRTVLRHMLSRCEDFNIEEAESGEYAILECENNLYDFIFVDIDLPNLSWIDMAKRIKNIYPNITIVAMATIVSSRVIDDFLAAKIESCITKPFSRNELQSKVFSNIANTQK